MFSRAFSRTMPESLLEDGSVLLIVTVSINSNSETLSETRRRIWYANTIAKHSTQLPDSFFTLAGD